MRKRIAVIGAGLSGLATIKELLEEGHDVVCFEKDRDIGGVFSETGSYDSVLLTVSNYFMAYSDFMPYDEEIKFWTRAEYKAYLDRYAEHFGLRQHIRFQCSLESLRKSDSGEWELTLRNADGTKFTESVDKVAVCSGQFQQPRFPDIPGMNSFPGTILHSANYKNAQSLEALKGKRVLCFGMGESAADVVTEVAGIAESTTLSLRRYHMFAARMVRGMPIDVVQTRAWHSLPARVKAGEVRAYWKIRQQPANPEPVRLLAQHILAAGDEPGSVVTKTERIFEAQANGLLVDIGGVTEINGPTVRFSSGRQEDFDAIVFCTGFKFTLPFLENQFQFNNIRECYLQTFHPKLRDEVVFIGMVRPTQGGVPLIAELLARYFALVCSEKRHLPANLEELAMTDAEAWRKEFYETPEVFGLVNGLRFNERVAELIGCRPKCPNLLTSPKAFIVYWLHHVWPCQYRLVGPGARQIAREKWLSAPSIMVDDESISVFRAIKWSQIVWMPWLKSLFARDEKDKWRPIFTRPRAAQVRNGAGASAIGQPSANDMTGPHKRPHRHPEFTMGRRG